MSNGIDRADIRSRSRFFSVAAAVLTAALLITNVSARAEECAVNPAPYVAVAGLPSDGFPVCYVKPDNAKYLAAFNDLQSRHVLERYAQFLAPLHLPHKLALKAMQCTPRYDVSPFYSPRDRTLHFCYEFYQILVDIAPTTKSPDGISRATVITGAWIGVLLHETGHALFDMLDVPVFGREEDAADQVAALIPLQFNREIEKTVVMGFAYFWFVAGTKMGLDPPTKAMDPKDPKYPKDEEGRCDADPFCHYSDVHGAPSQRFYNALCLGYGADPDTFADVVKQGWLPAARAEHCEREYKQVRSAFAETVLPFIDVELMEKVKSSKWLLPNELK
jgi:hypothetical protein